MDYNMVIAHEKRMWEEREMRKRAFAREQVEKERRSKEDPCPLCEVKRKERARQEEEDLRHWYNGLNRIQQILAKNRGEVPNYF